MGQKGSKLTNCRKNEKKNDEKNSLKIGQDYLDDPSSTPKMVENGPKRSKMTFFNTPIKPDVHLTHLTRPGLTHLTHPRV